MTVSLELDLEARRRGLRSVFVPTGQTGMVIAGWGIAVDAVVADFVAGAAERLVVEGRERGGDLLWVEGQGSLQHPVYSGVTLGLYHGSVPHLLVLCHEVGPHGDRRRRRRAASDPAAARARRAARAARATGASGASRRDRAQHARGRGATARRERDSRAGRRRRRGHARTTIRVRRRLPPSSSTSVLAELRSDRPCTQCTGMDEPRCTLGSPRPLVEVAAVATDEHDPARGAVRSACGASRCATVVYVPHEPQSGVGRDLDPHRAHHRAAWTAARCSCSNGRADRPILSLTPNNCSPTMRTDVREASHPRLRSGARRRACGSRFERRRAEADVRRASPATRSGRSPSGRTPATRGRASGSSSSGTTSPRRRSSPGEKLVVP